MISILPYLKTGGGNLYLRLSLITQDRETLERTLGPFLVMNDSDPLTRLIGAQFLTDAGSEIKKVFLLVQRDQYLLQRDELSPFNNRDIEDYWQQAFSFYSEEKKGHSLIVLADQINEKGRLMPFEPLFFCKYNQSFFHPPCPKCGLPLRQCYHDELLINSGLEAYSHSLKRYLHCPSCAASNSSDFYVCEFDPSDPPFLKDRRILMKEFGLLRGGDAAVDCLPCNECVNYQECYGPEQLVLSRIAPFSFYPFYMHIFEAMTLNALDFLSLVSGATFEELESNPATRREVGRMSCLKKIKQDDFLNAPLFFHEERDFLEVLYLKLTFLGEVFKQIISGEDIFKHPDLRICINRIWVKLSEQSSLLPFFWNFKVELLDISMPTPELASFHKLPASDTLFSLGLIWFYTLLVNIKQDFSKVSRALRETVRNFSPDSDFLSTGYSAEDLNSTFQSVNIFWDPERKIVDKDLEILWEKSLALGWSLFKASFHMNGLSKEEFRQQLESLREEIKGNLFLKKPGLDGRPALSETLETNEAIHDLLTRIVDKWTLKIDEEEELMETVVLKPENSKKEISPPRVQVEKQLKEDESLAETVILGPNKSTAGSFQRAQTKDLLKKEGDESSSSTVDTVDKKTIIQKYGGRVEEDESLAETIILMPENGKDKKKGKISEYRNSFKRIGQRDQDNI
jgi:hypothetical protein